jgi:hypothetical protein
MTCNRKKDYGFTLIMNNEDFFFIIIDYSFRYEILQVYLAALSKNLYAFRYEILQVYLAAISKNLYAFKYSGEVSERRSSMIKVLVFSVFPLTPPIPLCNIILM